MLLAILTPLLPAAIFLAFGAYWLSHTKTAPTASLPGLLQRLLPKDGRLTKAALLRLTAVTAAAEAVLFGVLEAVIRFGMFTDGKTLPLWALVLTASVPFAALFLHGFMPKYRRTGRLLVHLSVLLAALLTAEVLVCNAKSFTSEKNSYDLTLEEIIPQKTDDEKDPIRITSDGYTIEGAAEFILTGIPEGTHGILLHLEQPSDEAPRLAHVWLDMKDENSRCSYVTVRDRLTMAKSGDTAFSIDPYGQVQSLQLHFAMVDSPLELRGVTAVSALPFDFSAVRFLLLALLGALLLGILDFRFWEVTYTRTLPQRIAVAVVTVACTLSAVCFWEPGEELHQYRKSEGYSGYDPYILTFDAFQKGQVNLDIPVDANLENLQNVYDNSERNASDVTYRWDMAYKDGKYYSYFGVTPIIVLYYPVYLLTGKLPTVPIAVDVFATLAGLLLCLTILAAVRLLVKRPNFLLLLLSLPTAMGSGAVYTCLQYNDKYYEAVSCGMCFMLLTIWLGLRGCLAKKQLFRNILFFCCGLSMALCVGARPTMAVSTALLVPLFLGILLRRSEKLSVRLTSTVCFAVPLLCGMAGLLAYNNARFGSPLDFGSAYQLTVSDTHANTLQLSLLPAAWKHYLLQTPIPRTTFPYFEPLNSNLRNYGRYLYTDATYGTLALPCVLLGTLLLPLGLRRGSRQTTAGVTLLQKRGVLLICFAVPLFLAWVDFCMGGVNQRYVTDIMPLFTIGAVLVLLRTVDLKHHCYRYGIAALSLVLTCGMIWLLMIGLRDCALLRHCPTLYDAAENALVFWQ